MLNVKLILVLLLGCLTTFGQEFIPFLGTASPANNGLLNSLIWYIQMEGGAAAIEPSVYGVGQYFSPFDATFGHTDYGTTAGVINNARTQPANNTFTSSHNNEGDAGGYSGSFTISGWVKFNSFAATSQVIYSAWFADTQVGDYRLVETNAATKQIWFQVRNLANTSFVTVVSQPSVAMVTGTWYYIAAGYSQESGKIFIVVETNGAGSLPSPSFAAFGGVRHHDGYAANFAGDFLQTFVTYPYFFDTTTLLSSSSALDEWGWWHSALTKAQLDLLFAKTPFSSFQLR